MRVRRNSTKFIKRAYLDMGELKQCKGYTNTRLNIISNKVFLLKRELYPLKKPRKKYKFKKKKPTTLFRRFYINLKLKQLKKIYKKYRGNEKEILQYLEKRLDMVLLRSGFVRSIYEARQIINHKHILVNGKLARVPGYELKVGDIIGFNEGSHKQNLIKRFRRILCPKKKIRATGPSYLEISHQLLLISIIEEPKLSAIKYPFTLNPEQNLKFISLLKNYKRIR
ncbi:hypothetical protein ACTA71_008746 [Dictyostelium dimigraforme]